MRTKYSIYNMAVSVAGQFVNVILLFISRKIFIRCFAIQYLGVNGLFTNILTVLSMAELGIGTAMIYGLYRPAAEENQDEICRLLNLYRLLYRLVGAFVFAAGLALLPFLSYLVKDGTGIPCMPLIYLMYLFDTVSSYFLSYRQSVITAHQKTFLITSVTQGVRSLQILLQIGVILLTGNFYLYLALQIGAQFVSNLILARAAGYLYPYIRRKGLGLPEEGEKKRILKDISAMAMHKFGAVVVSNTDNLIISAFVGLASVGLYSNYKMILNSMKLLMSYLYGAVAAGIGNLAATSDHEKISRVHRELNFLLSMVYGYLAVCLFLLFNPFIGLFFGWEYTMGTPVVFLIVADFYLHGMRQITLKFRDGMGLYRRDRYKPVVEAVLNLVVSIALVKRFSVAGVLAGTIISTMLTNFWVEPLVFFKYGIQEEWKKKLGRYFVEYLKYSAVTVSCGVILWLFLTRIPDRNFLFFIGKGLLSTAVYAGAVSRVFGHSEEWGMLTERLTGVLKKRRAR